MPVPDESGLTEISTEEVLSTKSCAYMAATAGGWLGDRMNQRNLLILSLPAIPATSVCIYQTHA